MFKKSEEIKVRVTENARGGPGRALFYDWMSKEEAEGHGRLFTKIVLEPGSGIGDHFHEGEYETFYMLKGTAVVNDNGTEVLMQAGDFHKCASGEHHSITNTGEETAELIALIQSSGK